MTYLNMVRLDFWVWVNDGSEDVPSNAITTDAGDDIIDLNISVVTTG